MAEKGKVDARQGCLKQQTSSPMAVLSSILFNHGPFTVIRKHQFYGE